MPVSSLDEVTSLLFSWVILMRSSIHIVAKMWSKSTTTSYLTEEQFYKALDIIAELQHGKDRYYVNASRVRSYFSIVDIILWHIFSSFILGYQITQLHLYKLRNTVSVSISSGHGSSYIDSGT